MHEKNNCEMLGYKKRSELAEKSKVFVKLTDADLRWLIPLAERTKKNATPLPHKSFTIKDMDGRWETLIYVQEIQLGKIRVDGYAPIDCKNGKKNAVVNIYEDPYFSITFHFVLGVAECDSFFGRTVTKEKVWSDVKNRVIPIIIYMQNYYENAEKNEKKSPCSRSVEDMQDGSNNIHSEKNWQRDSHSFRLRREETESTSAKVYSESRKRFG